MPEPSSENFYELGGARLSAGDFEGAVTAYRAAAATAPGAPVLNNLAVALLGSGRAGDARIALEQALALQPDYVRALVNLGKTLGVLGKPDEAQAPLRRALEVSPDYLPALINLGDTQGACGEYEAAAQTLRRAIACAPQSADAHRSLGMALTRVGQTYDAINTLERAVSLQPTSAENHTSLAQVLLLDGRWHDAWPHFEFRLKRLRQALPMALPADARWDGGPPGEKSLWLVGEQGLGDQIQFSRYAGVLRERGLLCVLCCDPRLVALLRQAGLAHEVVPFGAPFDPACSRWMPLMSAPGGLQSGPDDVPLRRGYLQADPARVECWRARLAGHTGLRVALAWQGNPAAETGWFAGRSPPLATLEPLWAVDGVSYVSLQKGPVAHGLRATHAASRLIELPAFDEGTDAFLDSAAILCGVDLLVTSDSAIAHLAGALGVECWLCLHAHPDWRWLRQGDSSPWYTSMRVFRQTRPGNWNELFERVACALGERARRNVSRESRPGSAG